MKGERGFALVLALVVTALLVALLVEFVGEVYVDASHSHNFVASQQASILAESGVKAGVALLKLSRMKTGDTYTSLLDPWAKPIVYPTDDGTVTISIEEESGKLDLNSATSQTGSPNGFYEATLRRLLARLELSPDLQDVVADWVDTDATPRPGGAENSYYNTLKPPYQAHDQRLDTVEELAMLKGFTPQVLNKLRSCVTVYGTGPQFDNAPTAKININTAPAELLAALDDKLMSGDLVDRILEYRKTKVIKNLADISGLDTLVQSLQLKVGFGGTVYRVHAEGKVGDSVSVAEAVVGNLAAAKPSIYYWREY